MDLLSSRVTGRWYQDALLNSKEMDEQHPFGKACWPRDPSTSLSICSSSQRVTQVEGCGGPSVALVIISPLTPLAVGGGAQLGPRCGSGGPGWIKRSPRGELNQGL